MMTLFKEGGFPMWFLLAFGLGTLIFAVRYAMAPTIWAFRVTCGFSAATLATAVTATCAALAAVGHHAPEYAKRHPAMTLAEVVLQGVAESMSPGILGFTMLSLAAMIVTLGFYREGKG
ncbi:MAG TPA: hypothetical protein VFZ53_15335 [Polyangiaceae bacterium]